MLNRVTLIGRLGQEPEVKFTAAGDAACNFSIAVEREYKGSDGKKPVDWIPVVCWKQKAEFIGKYAHKGSLISVDGSLQARKYQTKEGENRTSYEVVANSVQIFGGSERDRDAVPEQTDVPVQVDELDDLPF